MSIHQPVADLVDTLAQFEAVEAILLGGSRGSHSADSHSDYDLYIYLNDDLSASVRQALVEPHFSYVEINNQFWETEDDGVLHDGTPVELIYRQMEWISAELVQTVEQHQAKIGYTTCFWYNLLNSHILFDRNGRAAQLQQRFTVAYPPQLRDNIIDKNYPLLRDRSFSFYDQIRLAITRSDWISVQHRLTAFLASYFDILFAINEQPHPGEKRIVAYVQKLCPTLPTQLEQHLLVLLGSALPTDAERVLDRLNVLVDVLDGVLLFVEQRTSH